MNDFDAKHYNQFSSVFREKLQFHNIMQFPRLEKIILNIGFGMKASDKKYLDMVFEQLKIISGQLPVKNRAKKSIANFKLREGVVVGCKVTLRKKKMYNFFERFVYVSLPRLKDFKGLSLKSFDGNGNYSVGIREHIIFPEIDFNKVEKIIGMDVTFVTNTMNDYVAQVLLETLGMPFQKKT